MAHFLLITIFLATAYDAPERPQRAGGEIRQGNYLIEYESFTKDRMLIYRVRNGVCKSLTPIRWCKDDIIFIEANLPPCPPQMMCEWIECTRTAIGKTEIDTSTFNFGINRNEHSNTVAAYLDKLLSSNSPQKPPLQTTLRGTVENTDGEPIQFAVRVTSIAKETEKGIWDLSYKIESLEPDHRQYKVLTTLEERTDLYAIHWDAFPEKAVKIQQHIKGPDSPATFSSFFQGEIVPVAGKLTIYHKGTRLISTTAPAYNPATKKYKNQ